MSCSFTYAHYKEICEIIVNRGYKIYFYEDVQSNIIDNKVILRHDIDLGLVIENAIKLAKIEHEYGLCSTFFVMVRSPFYNIFSLAESSIINEILSMNHRIGLHFDEKIYQITKLSQYERYIEEEKYLLEEHFKVSLNAVSMHRPTKYFIEKDIKFSHIVNTYNSYFFNSFKYLSDSRRFWREGCCCSWLEKGNIDKFQINIHPFWWTEEGINFDERFKKFVVDYLHFTDLNLSENISNWEVGKLSEWIKNA